MRLYLFWTCDHPGHDLAGWNLYVSENRTAKGARVATAPPGERSVAIDVNVEVLRFYRAVQFFRDGREEDWQVVPVRELFVHGRRTAAAPPTPANVAIGPVDPNLVGRVMVDPHARHETDHYLQVVVGPSFDKGRLVAEVPVSARGPLRPDASRLESFEFPLEGVDVEKSIHVRAMGLDGKAGPVVSRTVRTPPLDSFHPVAIASVDGATVSGFPPAAATDPFEFVATDGIRLRSFPICSALTGGAAGWGTGSAGLFVTQKRNGKYCSVATITTDEVDLGVDGLFRITVEDSWQRKAATHAARRASRMKFPAIPSAREDTRRAAFSASWFNREVKGNKAPRQPLRELRYEIAVAAASPANTFVPCLPGQLFKGKVVKFRILIDDPLGAWFQWICPTFVVRALLPRRHLVQTGTPEGIVTAPPGSTVLDDRSGVAVPYFKKSGVGNTGWSNAVVAIDRKNTTSTVASSTSEADLYRFSIPANLVDVGKRLHLVLSGNVLKEVAGILTIRVKLGATTLKTITYEPANDPVHRGLHLDVWIHHRAAADQASSGNLLLGSTPNDLWSTSAEAMTVVKELAVTAQWSVNSPSLSARVFAGVLELH